jgi:polyisoprenoid-binding protein YceI
MRVRGACKLLLPGALLLATLAGCPLRPPAATPPTTTPAAGAAPLQGRPYDIDGPASLLTIRVYRAGALASVGHNHVIASHELSGTLYVPDDVLRSSFEVRIPVDTLTVDEAALRAQQSGADFPPDVSDDAKRGTRRNMLGDALLDAARYPQILLRSVHLEPGPPGSDSVLAQVQSTVRGQQRTFAVRVHFELSAGTLIATGATNLRQSELGLTPFSAMLGALQVQDEMQVSFRIVAHAAPRAFGAPAAPHLPGQCNPSSASSARALYTLRSPSSMIVGSTATARLSSGSYQ